MTMPNSQPKDDNPYITNPDTDFRKVEELTVADAQQEVAVLRDAIRYHDYCYYVEADPVISDKAYDTLFSRLQTLEQEFGLESETSPTGRIGGEPVGELETVEHVVEMQSLEQSVDREEVKEFAARVQSEVRNTTHRTSAEYFCEPKFDGLSIEIVYEEGVYQRAATRGNGEEGDDVTEQVRTIPAVPERLRGDYPEFLAVRGEVYMPREQFQEYNRDRVEQGKDSFANPRNAAAGTLRQLDPSVVAERPLSIFYFDILDSTAEFSTQAEIYESLPQWGLRVADFVEKASTIEEAIEYRDRLLAARGDLPYEIDGSVLTVNDIDMWETLGTTARAPRWAFAYKFPARSERTTIQDIVVQVGRTGRVTPVALLDPVEVGGVTVARASLHNPKEIQHLGVNIGDRVTVKRAGDVIPKVDDVIEHNSEGYFEYPRVCPDCGTELERNGPLCFCPAGLSCPTQREETIKHYASRKGLDIEGLGGKRVTQLIEQDIVAEPADLYDLSSATLASLEGWGARSATELVEKISHTTNPPLEDFLTALGIPDIGPAMGTALAQHFGDFESVRDANIEELKQVEDVGPEVARKVHDFFHSAQNEKALDRLLEHVTPRQSDGPSSELDGKTFVFTGSLELFTRSEAQELVEDHGGNATSGVSGNTDFLVVGDNPGQRKQNDAKANHVPILSEQEFVEHVQSQGVEIQSIQTRLQ
jgi:DNA ligase (NAD+)